MYISLQAAFLAFLEKRELSNSRLQRPVSFPGPLCPWNPPRQGPGGIGLTVFDRISHSTGYPACSSGQGWGGNGPSHGRPGAEVLEPLYRSSEATQQELAGVPLQQMALLGESCMFKASCQPMPSSSGPQRPFPWKRGGLRKDFSDVSVGD